jgi:hypothetical protein
MKCLGRMGPDGNFVTLKRRVNSVRISRVLDDASQYECRSAIAAKARHELMKSQVGDERQVSRGVTSGALERRGS